MDNNLIKECYKRRDVKKYLSNLKREHEQFVYASTVENYVARIKVYSNNIIKQLYILKKFIKKRLIKSDYELTFVLISMRKNNKNFIKLINQFYSISKKSFVDSLNDSVYETAKQIQISKKPILLKDFSSDKELYSLLED